MNRQSRHHEIVHKKRRRNIFIVFSLLVLAAVVCVSATISSASWLFNSLTGRNTADSGQPAATWAADSAQLTVAVSPVMAPVLQDLANRFNSLDRRTPDGKKMVVWIVPMVPEKMIGDALGLPTFQAMSPDSSLWLDRLEQQWATRFVTTTTEVQIPIGHQRISEQVRYAVSPVVIAAWEDVARSLGWPDKAIGWQDIQRKATADANFKWNHPSTNNASGLLATLAEFYAGAGITRGLSEEVAKDPKTLAYVQAVEGTIRFYGEGEDVITQKLATDGRDFLDAFVGQERVVIDWNRTHPDNRLVAIYPDEGTLWTDHPLALLELGNQPNEPSVTDNQRLTFRAFTDFVTNGDSQAQLLAAGYRPADLSIKLDSPGSPFVNTDAVDWRQPQTTLQMPSPAVIDVVRNVWYYTKRPTNVYLVVDTSGSMEGEKIAATRKALSAFVSQIQGDRDRVGLVEFGSGTKNFLPLRTMNEVTRRDLQTTIDRMQASGGTALIDAVYAAVMDLKANTDDKAINAVVVMTDGQENRSQHRISDLEQLLRQTTPRIVVFTIGFGNDADESLLSQIANIGHGQFRRADTTDIEELYRIISTYF